MPSKQSLLKPENRVKNRIAKKQWKIHNRKLDRLQKKRHYQRHREDELKKRAKYQSDLAILFNTIFGDSCIICHSKKWLHLHEIHGKKHTYTRAYVLAHKKDFVRLCAKHHVHATKLMIEENLLWKDVLLRLNQGINI